MIKEWNAVSLSLSTSFLTWNVKRIQDTLLPNWNAKKSDMWWFSPYRHLFTWNVKESRTLCSQMKVRKSDKVAIGQHLVNKGQEWIGGEVGWNNELSPKEGSARRFFVFQIPCPAPTRQYETSRWWREIKRADAVPPSMHLLVLNLPNRRQSWPKAPTKVSPASKSWIPYFIYFI